jgi:hypothetical protein
MKIPFFTALRIDHIRVYGFYVYCRSHHYILQVYANAGYDERWETHEWQEIQIDSLEPYDWPLYLKENR